MSAEKCPVDHSATAPPTKEDCPVDHKTQSSWGSIFSSSNTPTRPPPPSLKSEQEETCPVNHEQRAVWTKLASSSSSTAEASLPTSQSPTSRSWWPWSRQTSAHPTSASNVDVTTGLSKDRVISSIPRHATSPENPHFPSSSTSSYTSPNSENWVYPSESQFFNAMAAKNHQPQAKDMRTIVPIHNAVNERAWSQILEWENGRGGERCGGVRLVKFEGKPEERTPKAWGRVLAGYSAPFDRHDWIVDRCGTRIRYVIDFYTGRPAPGTNQVSFYLDVRPALDSWEAMKIRTNMFWTRLWNQ
ncbi:cytochrome C1 heme lyase [Flagelloscypha sp. PMI_526]|nr:cytochrome C1 heme lyase [Flagelloscypha sp. PMI_526]